MAIAWEHRGALPLTQPPAGRTASCAAVLGQQRRPMAAALAACPAASALLLLAGATGLLHLMLVGAVQMDWMVAPILPDPADTFLHEGRIQ